MHHLLFHLISFLTHSMPLMFAGAVGAVSLPEVITGGVSEGSQEGGEPSEEKEIAIGGGAEENLETTEEVPGETQKASKEETQVDWKTVPPEVRAHIQNLKKDNPTLGNLVQNAVYTSQTFLREFPGGLKEAQAIKKDLEDLGGLETVKDAGIKFQQMQDEQEEMDNKARIGDVSVLDNLVEIAGEGFNKLMPNALDRWANTDPQGYSHLMSKIIVQTMQDSGVVGDLRMAIKMIGLNNPEATKIGIEGLQKVADWANNVNKNATTIPEKPKVDPKIAEQQKDINDQKAALFNRKFSDIFGAWRSSQIQDQLKIIAKDKKFNDYQINMVRSGVIEALRRNLSGDPDYIKILEKHYNKGLASNNYDELLKFTQSRSIKLIPDMTKMVYKRLYSNPGKVAIAKETPKVEAAAKGAVALPQGWTKISADKAPRPEDIDNRLTDFPMKFNKQAILKNGKKVFWGDKVPK